MGRFMSAWLAIVAGWSKSGKSTAVQSSAMDEVFKPMSMVLSQLGIARAFLCSQALNFANLGTSRFDSN